MHAMVMRKMKARCLTKVLSDVIGGECRGKCVESGNSTPKKHPIMLVFKAMMKHLEEYDHATTHQFIHYFTFYNHLIT